MIEIKGNKLYHSTVDNISNILKEGLKTRSDGCVYLADSIQNSQKFLFVRMIKKQIVTFEIDLDLIDKEKIDFSYDHNERFFGCKAYVYPTNIPTGAIKIVYVL